ncbi:MAG: Txe/YoeB family addiction module toxin [Flavisolibacter sp.]
MKIQFTQNAWEDFSYWLDNDTKVSYRIRELIEEIQKGPFRGTGKPEPLRHDLKGYWSRRITAEHRLVYRVDGKKGENQNCYILQCRFHYDD